MCNIYSNSLDPWIRKASSEKFQIFFPLLLCFITLFSLRKIVTELICYIRDFEIAKCVCHVTIRQMRIDVKNHIYILYVLFIHSPSYMYTYTWFIFFCYCVTHLFCRRSYVYSPWRNSDRIFQWFQILHYHEAAKSSLSTRAVHQSKKFLAFNKMTWDKFWLA